MPIEVNIVDQKYFREIINAQGFTLNSSDFTRNLVGSVMEKVKVQIQVAVSWAYWAAASNGTAAELTRLVYLEIFDTDQLLVNRKDGGNFIEDGLYPNQKVRIRAGNNYYSDKTVVSVQKENMVIDLDGVTTLGTISVFGVFGDEPLTAMVQNFGLIENKETFSTESKVSGNNQGYYGVDIGIDTGSGRTTDFVEMTRIGKYRDWITGEAKVRYVGQAKGIFNTGSLETAQVFEIQHEIIINPWYLEGQIDNLINNVIPDDLKGENSYKYVFNLSLREVISNPNTAIDVAIEDVLGSTAWFGESFNGFQNNYNIKSVSYEDSSGNPLDGLLISGETTVTIVVEKLEGSFNSGDYAGIYISRLPNQDQYTDTVSTNLVENFIYDRCVMKEGVPQVGDYFITSMAVDSGTDMEIVVKVEFPTDISATIAEDFNNGQGRFIIGVQNADSGLTPGNSDSVINYLLGEFDQSPDIPGLIALNNFGIYPMAGDPELVGAYSSLESWIEDGLLCEFGFNLDLSKEAVLNSLEVVCLAYNSTTGQFFELDNFPININPILNGGIQEIQTTESRNYILATNDPYNEVIVETANKVGDFQNYIGRFAQKVPWQDWISNPETDSVFYDKTKPEDGLNLKSDQFSDKNDYEIHFGLKANVSGVSDLGVAGVTDYLLLGPKLIVNNYNENVSNGSVNWTTEIKTFNPVTNVDLNGGLLDGQDTLIKCVWENSGGAVTDLANIFAAIRIEETQQPGFAITELTNVRDAQNNQLLYGSINPLRLRVYLQSGNVVCEAVVRGSSKIDGQSYNISAAIKSGATPPFDSGFDYVNGFLIN